MILALLAYILSSVPAALPKCVRIPSGSVPFDSTQATALAGSYTIGLVDTTRTRSRVTSMDVILWVNDSAHRFRAVPSPTEYARGERFLGGTFKDSGKAWTDPDNPYEGVTYQRTYLRLGSMGGMLDGTGTNLTIRHISSAGFSGGWKADLGIAVYIDAQGNYLPNPAGYFCAYRVEPPAEAPRQHTPPGV